MCMSWSQDVSLTKKWYGICGHASDFVSYHLSLGLETELNVEATIDAIGASGLIILKANLVGGVRKSMRNR